MPNIDTSKEPGSYHHGNLREALIAEGRRLLEEAGPTELSLRQIARSVGVSEAAPARHFESKEALLVAIAVDGFLELAALRRKIGATTNDPRQRAYRMLASYVKFARQHRGLFDLMIGPRLARTADYPELLTAVDSSFSQFADSVCDYARAAGWPDASMHLLTHAAWAVEHGLATLIIGKRIPKEDRPVKIDAMIDFSINLLLSGIRAGPAAFEYGGAAAAAPADWGSALRGAPQPRRRDL